MRICVAGLRTEPSQIFREGVFLSRLGFTKASEVTNQNVMCLAKSFRGREGKVVITNLMRGNKWNTLSPTSNTSKNPSGTSHSNKLVLGC